MKFMKVVVSVVFLIVMSAGWSAQDAWAATNKWTRLVERCGTVLDEIQQMPESIPEDLLKSCEGIAIFPDTISAGFGIGGRYGQGIIMVRGERDHEWSPPAIFTIAGGSIGWQIGGQSTDIVLLLMSRRSVNGILTGKIKLGADAAVAAGPVGRDASAATNVQLGGILSYSRTRGLFIGVKLEGTVITQHWDGDEGLYGKQVSADDILENKKVKMPDCAEPVLDVLNDYPYRK